jgi:protein-S-isoprenylcysteine O-methyltransferase Ste14
MTRNLSTTFKPENPKLDRDGMKRIFVVLAYVIIESVVLFVSAGRLNWPGAWAYTGLRLAIFLTVGIWVARRNPELINERGRRSPDTKSWDKVFAAVYTLFLIITPIIAGLDARNEWSSVSLIWQTVGFLGLIPAMILPYWAMSVNKYMVTTVRIQTERGHQVVSTGPYQYVRHPMYVGAVLMALFAPLLLGTWWTFVPSIIVGISIVVRTALEDRTLQAELPGYTDYAQQVRYRLLPGIW